MAVVTTGRVRSGRVITGVCLISLAVGLALYGYFAPPRLAFDETLGFVAAPGFDVGAHAEYWCSVMFRYDMPAYPYPHAITEVSIPDSPLQLEWSDYGEDGLWVSRHSLSLRIFAPAPGQYEVTKLRLQFGKLTRVYDIGRVVIDARDTVTARAQLPQGGVIGVMDGGRLSIKERSDHYVDTHGNVPVKIVRMEAGEFGTIEGPVPESDGNLTFSFDLPPQGTRPRSIWIRPWLTVSDGKRESLTIGMTYEYAPQH